MSSVKDITVVVPCFNSKQHIAETIESVIAQQRVNVELIVVDGASTDGTLEVLKKYDKSISLLISENDTGVVEALNKGFNRSTAKLLCWLNSDDVYINKYALAQAKASFKCDEIGFAYGHAVCCDKNGIITRSSYAWRSDLYEYQRWANIFTGSLFFTQKAWVAFGGFDEKYSVIFEYQLLDFLFSNFRLCLIEDHIAALRRYDGTLSDRLKDEIPRQIIELRGEVHRVQPSDILRRFCRLVQQGLFVAVAKNKFRDRYANRFWRDVLNESAIRAFEDA